MFERLSFRLKVLLVFFGVSGFVLLASFSGFFALKKINKNYEVVTTDVMYALSLVNEIGVKSQESNRYLLLSYMAMFESQLKVQKEKWLEVTNYIHELNVKYQNQIKDQAEKRLYQDYLNAWNSYKEEGDSFLSNFGKFDEESSMKALIQNEKKLNPAREMLNKSFQDLFNYQTKNAQNKGEAANALYEKAIWILGIISILGMVLSQGIGWGFANYTNKKLNGFSKKIMKSSHDNLQTSEELSVSSGQLSESATESAASVQETVSSLEELSSMVKLNSDHANEASSLAHNSLSLAEVGEKEVKELIQAMIDVSVSSKEIADITNVIDEIAFQTNLLALNAAVEAARAGDQGKGFAVVAEAVRALASRSSQAAKDINQLISESVQKAENGLKVADQSSSALNKILTAVEKVAQLNSEISVASKEQSNGIEQISKAMNHLDQAIQMNANSAQEVAKSSAGVSKQSEVLSSVVGELDEFIEGKANHSDDQKIKEIL